MRLGRRGRAQRKPPRRPREPTRPVRGHTAAPPPVQWVRREEARAGTGACPRSPTGVGVGVVGPQACGRGCRKATDPCLPHRPHPQHLWKPLTFLHGTPSPHSGPRTLSKIQIQGQGLLQGWGGVRDGAPSPGHPLPLPVPRPSTVAQGSVPGRSGSAARGERLRVGGRGRCAGRRERTGRPAAAPQWQGPEPDPRARPRPPAPPRPAAAATQSSTIDAAEKKRNGGWGEGDIDGTSRRPHAPLAPRPSPRPPTSQAPPSPPRRTRGPGVGGERAAGLALRWGGGHHAGSPFIGSWGERGEQCSARNLCLGWGAWGTRSRVLSCTWPGWGGGRSG